MLTRRQFLKIRSGRGRAVSHQQGWRPGESRLCADPRRHFGSAGSSKVRNALAHPARHAEGGHHQAEGRQERDYYEISMKQITQQILPAGLPATTVWGYGAVNGMGKNPLLVHNAPSLTIEAKANTPVRIKWINDLKDANGNYLPHLLPVDPTLHWANPPGGDDASRHPADFRIDAWPVHRPRPHRHPCPWRGRGR